MEVAHHQQVDEKRQQLPPRKEKNWTIHECVLICFLFFFLVQFLPLPLAEAKYGDQQFWKPKIHVANG
jgi:hypothetical protein